MGDGWESVVEVNMAQNQLLKTDEEDKNKKKKATEDI